MRIAVGTVIGSSTVIGEAPPREYESGVSAPQSILECSCGRRLFRRNDYLRRASRLGFDVCCEECLSELRRGYFSDKAQRESSLSRSRFLETWKRYGSLYGPAFEESFSRGMLRDLVEEFGPISAEAEASALRIMREGLTCSRLPTGSGIATNQDAPQQNQWLIRIDSKAGWSCSSCVKPFASGFGCVRCLEPVCERCYGAMRHICPREWADSWKAEEPRSTKDLLDLRAAKLQRKQLKALRIESEVA